MLYFTYSLDILILFAAPILLGVFLVRKYELEGRWWWIGAIVYGISQALLIPLGNYLLTPFLNNLSNVGTLPSMEVLILGALLLGVSTGVCEEFLRYCMFRWWTKDARTFMSGLLLGTGHGGAASIFLGCFVLYNFLNMVIYRNMDLSTLVSSDQARILHDQIATFWSEPWYYTLREAVGQIFMLAIQVSLTVIMLQTFIRKQWLWILLAIGFHSMVETVRVILLNVSTEFNMISVLGAFAIISVVIIFSLRHPKKSDHLPSNL
jgi:uncharacterized membrane protein YhfC